MSAELQHALPLAPETVAAAAPVGIVWQRGVLELPQPFRLDSGAVLESARLAWQCVGPADAPLVIALGGISAHRRVCSPDGKGWWEEQCGAGKTLDTARFRVLGVDWLGGCDESTGPHGDRDFPVVSTADQARAILALLNRLGVRRVHLLVGASYGGNVAQQLAALLGERLRRLVLLSAAHRPAQFGLALRHIQRSILDLGGDSAQAQALARELAVLCYRTTEGVEQRFSADSSRNGVVGWLRHHGEKFTARFDTAAYRCLGQSIDGHFIDPATIRAPTTVFAVREDLTVPLSLLHEYVTKGGAGQEPKCLGGHGWPREAPIELFEISSPHGHDAFLKETAAVSRVLASALETVE